TDVVTMAVSAGVGIDAAHPTNSWETVGVNNKHQLATLERIFQRNQADRLLEQGVMLADPARIDIRGQLLCGENVEIDIGCIFEGEVRLGDNVKIKANCILRNTVIDSGTVVSPYSLIDEAKVGINCRIGPFARIRPGTNLDNAVH